jgi:hypothetical protein
MLSHFKRKHGNTFLGKLVLSKTALSGKNKQVVLFLSPYLHVKFTQFAFREGYFTLDCSDLLGPFHKHILRQRNIRFKPVLDLDKFYFLRDVFYVSLKT